MINNSNNQGITPAEVDKIVVSRVKKMIGIKSTGDTPTDAKQLVNKQYVDTEISSVISVISSAVGTAAGQSTQIQFNQGGNFGASSALSYGQVSIVGVLTVGAGSVYGRVTAQELQVTPLTSGGNAGEAHYYVYDQGKMDIYTDSTTTTNNTFTALTVIPLASGQTINVTARILGHRTGGSAGSAGDTSFYLASATFTRDTISAQIGTTTTLVTHESNANTDFQFVLFGSQPQLQVKGDTNNDYTWDVLYTLYYIYP